MDFDFEEEQAKAGAPGAQPRRPCKIRRSDEEAAAGPVPVDGADFFRPHQQEPPAPPAEQ